MEKIIIQEGPINVSAFLDDMAGDSDGAVVFFVGRVRNTTGNRDVKYLEYEIYHDMAEKELGKILSLARSKWDFNMCILVHRYGRVEIGEASILIAVSSGHRDEAFKAARFIIDTVKKKVPIWKKEFYKDGSSWVGMGS